VAIERADGPAAYSLEVEAGVVGDEVTLVVHDEGRRRAPRGGDGGRGLVLIEQLTDAFEIDRTQQGTTVRMYRRLGGEDGASPQETGQP